MDDDDGSRRGVMDASSAWRVDRPAVVLRRGRRWDRRAADTREAHVVELGDEVEERIAGAGDEDLVAWIAEEAEEEAVGLAGAGGEADVVERNAWRPRSL